MERDIQKRNNIFKQARRFVAYYITLPITIMLGVVWVFCEQCREGVAKIMTEHLPLDIAIALLLLLFVAMLIEIGNSVYEWWAKKQGVKITLTEISKVNITDNQIVNMLVNMKPEQSTVFLRELKGYSSDKMELLLKWLTSRDKTMEVKRRPRKIEKRDITES